MVEQDSDFDPMLGNVAPLKTGEAYERPESDLPTPETEVHGTGTGDVGNFDVAHHPDTRQAAESSKPDQGDVMGEANRINESVDGARESATKSIEAAVASLEASDLPEDQKATAIKELREKGQMLAKEATQKIIREVDAEARAESELQEDLRKLQEEVRGRVLAAVTGQTKKKFDLLEFTYEYDGTVRLKVGRNKLTLPADRFDSIREEVYTLLGLKAPAELGTMRTEGASRGQLTQRISTQTSPSGVRISEFSPDLNSLFPRFYEDPAHELNRVRTITLQNVSK